MPIIAVVMLAIYLASPYVARQRFINAVARGDRSALDGLVDFPSVRQDVREQLMAVVETRRNESFDVASLSGIRPDQAEPIIRATVDALVTPAGMLAVRGSTSRGLHTTKVSQRFLGLNTFEVAAEDETGQIRRTHFTRRGALRWQVTRLDIRVPPRPPSARN
ncbi:MAG: DUF2939 domain-containing protein [Myxococcales bacterium]|nr:DUF2939 domain-containing protein [Myxococcales bacterium]